MGGQHGGGFSQGRAPLVYHGCTVHLTPVGVGLGVGLDVRQGVVGERVGDVAHHGGLGHGHALRVQSRQVGRQGPSQVGHRVNGDVSDGLGGDLLVSGGRGWSRRDGLRGGGGGAGRGGYVSQLLVIGLEAVTDGLDDGGVGDGGVGDDGGLHLHRRGLDGVGRQLGRRTRGRGGSDGLGGRRSVGRGRGQDARERQGGVLDRQVGGE